MGKTVFFTLIALIAITFGVSAFLFFEFENPAASLNPDLQFLGLQQTVEIKAEDQKSGLRTVQVTLTQGDKKTVLLEKSFPRESWINKAGPALFSEQVPIDIKQAKLSEGNAVLELTVRDYSMAGFFQGNRTVLRKELQIDTKPPLVTIEHSQKYIQGGGSGIVIYSLGEEVTRHGVQIDSTFFPGYPLAGQQGKFIAYIALPWNSEKLGPCKVVAVDKAGNEGKVTFSMHFKKLPEKRDNIVLGNNFLESKIPEFESHYPEMKGAMLEKYLFVNTEIRNRNNAEIEKISKNTVPEQLWKDSFLRMPGSPRAGFADQRTYFYEDKAIDEQTHLGVDIAATAQFQVKAANSGRVVFADYLGIYGNMVILDHGQGVASLYSHLSSIEVTVGQSVNKEQPLGRTGTSGMAGGDHLHFSMLVNGIFVMPKEWWDQHWIDVNINEFIGK